jgi:virginiamycin B lyase
VAALAFAAATVLADDSPPSSQHSISELHPVARIHLGKTADWVAVTDDAVWVGTTGPGGVAQIDPRTNTVIAAVALPGNPCAGLAVGEREGGITTSPDSVWLVIDGRATLARIDPNTLHVTRRIGVPPGSLNPLYSEGAIWVTRSTGAELTVVNADSGALVATVSTGPKPHFLTAGAGLVWTTSRSMR